MNLQEATIDQLTAEILSRGNLLDGAGVMPFGLYKIACATGVLPCTDGVAVRRRNFRRQIEAMAIRRGTGCFKGRLGSVGGRILRGESMEDCLRRQFRTDLGVEIEMLLHWKTPADIGQAAPLENPLTDPWPKDFGPEDRKHTNSCYYPVRLLGEPKPGGGTAHGGVEAPAVEWYTLDTLPPPEAFGYDQHPKFVACIKAAEKLI